MNPDTGEVRQFPSRADAVRAGFTVPIDPILGTPERPALSAAALNLLRMPADPEKLMFNIRNTMDDINRLTFTEPTPLRRGHGGTRRKFKTRERVSR